MLLAYGMGVQRSDWHVFEDKPPCTPGYTIFSAEKQSISQTTLSCLYKPGMSISSPFMRHMKSSPFPTTPSTVCIYIWISPNSNLRRIIDIPLEGDAQMANLIQAFSDGITAGSPFRYMEHLTQAFETLCLSRNLFARLDARASGYLHVIRKIYRSNTGLESAAAELGYSTGHFNRCFKQQFGVPPHQYIISLRMSDAIRMLSSDMPLDAIGSAIGYNDGRSFANAFRNYYGISPSEYRSHYIGRA